MKNVLFWLAVFTFCTGLIVTSCGDDDSSSSTDADTDIDGDTDTDTDSDTDSDSDETCEYEDSLQCFGDMIQTCTNGVWVDFQDCTLTGQYCEMQGLFAVCVDDPPDTDTDTDTGDDSYYGSCNDIVHSGICFDYLGSAYSYPTNIVELTCPTIDPTTVYQDELCGTEGDNFVGHCEYNASVGDPTTAMVANFYTPNYDTSNSDAEDFCNDMLIGTWHAAE